LYDESHVAVTNRFTPLIFLFIYAVLCLYDNILTILILRIGMFNSVTLTSDLKIAVIVVFNNRNFKIVIIIIQCICSAPITY